MGKKASLIILFSVLSVMVTQISKAAVINVTTTLDNVPGSLRAAITTANTNGEDNTIYLPVGTFKLSGSAMDDDNISGDLDIGTNHKLNIIGQGENKSYIDGNYVDRVLHILKGTVIISDLTVRRGKAPDNLGKGWGCGGAGISNCGNLTLTRCIIEGNTAGVGGDGGNDSNSYSGGYGGGIANGGELVLNNCTVRGNKAGKGGDNFDHEQPGDGGGGGGISNSGILTLNKCTITGNSAGDGGNSDLMGRGSTGGCGGGIYNTNISNINYCTISSNRGGYAGRCEDSFFDDGGSGGGIYNWGNLTMYGCAINNNRSGWGLGGSCLGGGVCNNGNAYLTLTNCTVSRNYAFLGGGIFNGGNAQLISVTVVYNEGIGVFNESTISLKNSIVATNIGDIWGDPGPDCVGTFDWVSYSLIGDTTGCTLTGFQKDNILGEDPLLGPLADNGGPTKTHALLPGSPAIDAGNSSGLHTDQRGYKRPINILGIPNVSDGADIGAYEYIAPYSTADSR